MSDHTYSRPALAGTAEIRALSPLRKIQVTIKPRPGVSATALHALLTSSWPVEIMVYGMKPTVSGEVSVAKIVEVSEDELGRIAERGLE